MTFDIGDIVALKSLPDGPDNVGEVITYNSDGDPRVLWNENHTNDYLHNKLKLIKRRVTVITTRIKTKITY